MSNNTDKRKRKSMKQSKQKQKVIQLTPEEEQDRKHLIALALVEELKRHEDASDTTARAIIIRRAKEYARYCRPISKVSKELYQIVVVKEKLCKKTNFYAALRSEEFEQFKDMHQSKRGSHSNKTKSKSKSGFASEPQVTNFSSVVGMESKTSPDTTTMTTTTKPKTTTRDELQLPQHVIDARQAIEESNEIQSALGKLVKLLSGELTEEQKSKREDDDIGKSAQRKLVEQSTDYLRILVKRIPDGHFRSIEVAIGWASLLIEEFEEAITNEAIIRKRNEPMTGV